MIEPSVAYGAEGVHAWFRKHTIKLVAAGCLALGVFAFGSDEADAMADSDGYWFIR